MRNSIALVIFGEVLALIGVGMWSVATSLVILGVQLVALGLVRESREASAAQPARRRGTPTIGVHRRRASFQRFVDRARPKLKLIRGAAS